MSGLSGLERQFRSARLVNLLLPGGGMVLLGRLWPGALVGLLFAAAACLAIAATLLFPADVRDWVAGLAVGVACGIYLGAQVRFGVVARGAERARVTQERRRVLHRVVLLMQRGEHRRALGVLRALEEMCGEDLLVAYRRAQILTALEDEAAADAWRRLRRLDRHKIYRGELEAHRHVWDPGSAAGAGESPAGGA